MQLIFISIDLIVLNFILYIAFGTLVTRRIKGESYSFTLSIIVGFFLYYSVFTLFCVPLMILWEPLSLLSTMWVVVVCIIVFISVIMNAKLWIKWGCSVLKQLFGNPLFWLGMAILITIQVLLVVNAYNFTLDATYYVGNVATSVRTNTMNIYNPYTGNWLDHFEMRYFFATYPMQDAVMCQVTGIHPLVQTKTVMSTVVFVLTNIVYYKIARELWENNKIAIFLTMLFTAFLNFNFITIYTSSNFLLTRTFEGKAIVGNVIMPVIVYLFMRLLKDHKSARDWFILFIICFGSTTISNTSSMLVPAALSIFLIPLIFIKKDLKIIPKFILCLMPGVIMMLTYVAYVKGYFVLFTHPR